MVKKAKKEKLSPTELKTALWETLQDVRAKRISPLEANSVATQSREICRVIKTQIDSYKLMNKKPTKDVDTLLLN